MMSSSRQLVTAAPAIAGAIGVRGRRVNDRRTDPEIDQRCRFSFALLPSWCRKTPTGAEQLPLLYPHGLDAAGVEELATRRRRRWSSTAIMRRCIVEADRHHTDDSPTNSLGLVERPESQ